MKRLFALLLVLCMMAPLSAFAYDGNGPISDEKVKLSVLTGYYYSYPIEEMDWVQQTLKNANVELDIQIVDDASYKDVVIPRLAAGVDLPDIVKLPTMDQDMSYLNSGVFVDLTEYYEKYGYNMQKLFEKTPGLKETITTPDHKIFYIPVVSLSADYSRCIAYNTEWLKELGREIPTTVDEFYEVLKLMKETDLNHNGEADEVPLFLLPNYLQCFGSMWGLNLNNRYAVDENGVVTCSYTTDAYKDFLTFFKKLYDEGLLFNEFATSTVDIRNNLLANNRTGCMMTWLGSTPAHNAQLQPGWQIDKDEYIWEGAAPFKGPYGDQAYWASNSLSGYFGITKFCKDPEAAFCFLDYCMSEESTMLRQLGIEGEDYTVVDGKIQLSEASLKDENDYLRKKGSTFTGIPYAQGVESVDIECGEILAAKNLELRPYYKAPLSDGFAAAEDLELIQTYSTDLNSYMDEMMLRFITGDEPLDQFENYVQNLKALHVDDIVAIWQKRYDSTK